MLCNSNEEREEVENGSDIDAVGLGQQRALFEGYCFEGNAAERKKREVEEMTGRTREEEEHRHGQELKTCMHDGPDDEAQQTRYVNACAVGARGGSKRERRRRRELV